MASVVVEKGESARVLSFGRSLNLWEWRFTVFNVLFWGVLVSVLPMAMGASPAQVADPIWMFLPVIAIWLIMSLREIVQRRQDRFSFERLQKQLVIEMEIPTQTRTPSVCSQTIFSVVMISEILAILFLGMARSAEYEISAVIGRLLFGGVCGFLLIFSYAYSLWMAYRTFQTEPMEGLTLYNRGLLWGTGNEGWNLYVPWPLIERVSWNCGTNEDSKSLTIRMRKVNGKTEIPFRKIRDEDWEKLLGVIGKRVEVVAEREVG